MSRKTISLIIGAYLVYLLVPVLFRLDYFPMTWAPMYSAVKASDSYVISALDRDYVRNVGFVATHQDGTVSNITYKDLNVPFRSFWQIYSQRTYGFGPQVTPVCINDHGPYNYVERDWVRKIFEMVNRTLGYDPGDDKYVVALTVAKSFHFFENTKSDMTLARTIHDTLTIRVDRPDIDPREERPYLKDVVE